MWFKMCPNCGGDLFLRENVDGKEIACMQCSRILRQDRLAKLLLGSGIVGHGEERYKVA
ncbi:MAG: hypothetical protein L0177_18860 [Chloroflexi bacterium]|nr:hypothetical protein [Chloroflexota bacterium]